MIALNNCEYRRRCSKRSEEDICIIDLAICPERISYEKEREITFEQIEKEKYGDNWRDIK